MMNATEENIPTVLLCCDLDRTLIPNGSQTESAQARPLFRELCAHPAVHLALVTGRHLQLVTAAIEQWQLPVPDFIIGDVGTSIYTLEEGHWRHWDHWSAEIGPDWGGMTHQDITTELADISAIILQPAEQQGLFKVSYQVDMGINRDILEAELLRRLWGIGVNARLVLSFDEMTDTGLLDILPSSASKLHAIEFLGQQREYPNERTVFAGDSGNDLEVLGSHIHSVLVANAHQGVQEEAIRMAAASDLAGTLYMAHGGFLGMNGNYSAGVLEGLAHYLPETAAWMKLPACS
ncbi:HAD-IIB family hydrolase [Acidithiobacillus sp.]|uniref:HAD-IIB family hydrolase n=1 Tax=Acidithiobacillus sp. TaxID=1872118 RepID=UPI00260FFCC6|nr:HAD-IIB family hydrolase [Acidithiobacillus sp.]MDD2749763.1 HAD-IIB family hydrolase [Acidithiobacillus sp.]MDD5278103.1 HAD-IIB family hydrolase [Acidithiobacillus sp.]